MTLPLVAVVVLVLGLLFHLIATGAKEPPRGMPTLAELGRAMMWVGLFFLVWALMPHGSITLAR
jgi:hypothetical protein